MWNYRVSSKTKKNKLATKNTLFGYLGWTVEKVFSYLKSTPSNLSNFNFFCKNGNSRIRDQKCLIWVFLGWKLPEILSYLISASSNLSCCENKILKFGTRSAWFGYLGSGSWKYYCHIWNQHPRICLIAKFTEKKNA